MGLAPMFSILTELKMSNAPCTFVLKLTIVFAIYFVFKFYILTINLAWNLIN
jgi:hypothetical protein